MKKITFLSFFIFFIAHVGFSQSDKNIQVAKGKITFKEYSFDFKDIKQGTVVEHTFQFENTGNATMVITRVQTTCGCTATKWTKEPIPPNGKGEISAQFNSAGKQGPQTKVITVISDASNAQERITIKANILPVGSN